MKTLADIGSRIAQGFESSCGLTPEFRSFATASKRIIKKTLAAHGVELTDFRRGHFEFSGYYTKNGKTGYFSICDVRGSTMGDQMMFRTAEGKSSSQHGSNRWVAFQDQAIADRLVSIVQ